jgi:hypothetical protein
MVFVAVVVAIAVGAALWAMRALGQRRTELQEQRARLRHAAQTSSYHQHDRNDVPLPVGRYLNFALGERREAPNLVTLTQSGSLRTDVASKKWLPFRATHEVAPGAHGFIWNAEVRLALGAHLRVLDSLLEGVGEGRVLFMSALEVAKDRGTAELNSAALQRFLAEAVWYPWALLPSQHLRWSPIDDSRARASLTVAESSVSVEFRFAPTGEVTGIFAPGRWRRVGKSYVLTAWEGHFGAYLDNGGVLVPHWGEVGWICDDHLELVWQGKVESIQLQY